MFNWDQGALLDRSHEPAARKPRDFQRKSRSKPPIS